MAKKPTLNDVMGKIDDLANAVSGLASHMDQRFDEQDAKFATKEDLLGLASHIDERFATKDDMNQMKNEVITEIDRFVVLHQTLDQEQMAQRSRFDRNEEFLARVATRLEMEYQRT